MSNKFYQKPSIYPPFYSEIAIARAQGVYVYDDLGRKFIDLSSSAGMACVGYAHPRIKRIIKAQAEKLIIAPQKYRTVEAEKLVRIILSLFPSDYDTVMPAVTGSEAVEIAMQAAVKYTGRRRFLGFAHAYHGHTMAAGALGAGQYDYGLCSDYFSTISVPTDRREERLSVNKVIKKLKGGAYAALIIEGVVTNDGYLLPPSGFIQKLRQICDNYGTLLIFDEVLTGFGRTGKMFSFEHHKIKPDFVCLSKGLAGGYAAIAAVVCRRQLTAGYDFFSTFAWSPLACAVAAANIEIIIKDNLVGNSRRLGRLAIVLLKRELANCPLVKDVRGLGLGIALVFHNPKDTNLIFQQCLEAGVILFRNIHLNMLFIQPPLIIKKNELERAVKKIIMVISAASH